MENKKEVSESVGFFDSLWGSLRHHIEERSKSPFAGAFLFSWVAVNWKELLVLSFSDSSIEQRIFEVAPHFQDIKLVLFWPLLLAVAVASSYYLIAVLFLSLSELYRLLSSKVQRIFELREWMPAPRFAQLKAKYLEKIADLTKLAADNIEEVTLANTRTTEAQLDAATARSQYENYRGELSIEKTRTSNLVSEKSNLEGLLEIANAVAEANSRRAEGIRTVINPVSRLLSASAQEVIQIGSKLEQAKRGDEKGNINAFARLANQHPTSVLSDSDIELIQNRLSEVSRSLQMARETIEVAIKE